MDASSHTAEFAAMCQYFMSRCQHHVHKFGNGNMVIPNACRPKHNSTECKHKALSTKLMSLASMQKPLLIRKGIAQLFQQRRGAFDERFLLEDFELHVLHALGRIKHARTTQ